MPLWIFFRDRIPDDLLTENGFSVLHRSDFPIAAAQVESDAASIQVSSERRGGFFSSGQIRRMHDFEAPFVDPSPHDLCVEFSRGRLLVMIRQSTVQFLWSVEMNAITTPRPK